MVHVEVAELSDGGHGSELSDGVGCFPGRGTRDEARTRDRTARREAIGQTEELSHKMERTNGVHEGGRKETDKSWSSEHIAKSHKSRKTGMDNKDCHRNRVKIPSS
eukprot:scaffold18911_cov32-Tisochrysis_lutea.AAC.3